MRPNRPVSVNKLQLSAILAAVVAANPLYAQYIIGHRGASHIAPENTLAAFRLAWRLGADGIEGDFHLSADGRIVCIHDKDTERVAGQKLIVRETNFRELRKLDVGAWKSPDYRGERIPTLDEVLATAPRGKMVFIELKCGPEIVEPLERALQVSTAPLKDLIVISFNADVIAKCEQRMPDLKSYWLTSYKEPEEAPSGVWSPVADEVAATIERIQADGLGSKALPEHFDEQFVTRLRDQGIDDFHVWTVDDPKIGALYKRLGAWSITTNRPGYLRRQLQPSVP